MNVDLTFNQFAIELYRDHYLTYSDLCRTRNSLAARGSGFIRDLDELGQCIRNGLSTGLFQLSERLRCVFRKDRASVLPKFLGLALARVFHPDGSLRDDLCAASAATTIQFCSALKRTDPPASQVKELESKVWSDLRNNFEDRDRVMEEFHHFRSQYPTFVKRLRHHFRAIVDIPLDVHFATGPGKNLEGFESRTALDWYVTDPYLWHETPPASVREYFDKVVQLFNRTPFEGLSGSRYPLRAQRHFMRCSAQPKSYKAYRGVGVMSALRMSFQLSLQRAFYSRGLSVNMPLSDQDSMKENLREHFWEIGTIDLSSASDRLYWDLLVYLGEGISFFDACYWSRTHTLGLPDGELHCSSPVMGEAITFPLMSAFFLAVCRAVSDFTGSDASLIRVYGDDIQTPDYDVVMFVLRCLGSKPSADKSYPPTSYFKESCECHLVATDSGHLRNARPCYIPSWSLNVRGRMAHVDAFKHLTLAKDAYLRCTALSRACCDLVEEKTNLRLPTVPFFTTHLGRPALTAPISGHVRVVLRDSDSETVGLRHRRRSALVGATRHLDPKLSGKISYQIMTKELHHLEVHWELAHILEACIISAYHKNTPLEDRITHPGDAASYLRLVYPLVSHEQLLDVMREVRLGLLKNSR